MKAIDCLEHIVTEGERWDTLAWRYYGDPYAYGRILQANPALDMRTVLVSGTQVLIPLLSDHEQSQGLAAEDLPPWKR